MGNTTAPVAVVSKGLFSRSFIIPGSVRRAMIAFQVIEIGARKNREVNRSIQDLRFQPIGRSCSPLIPCFLYSKSLLPINRAFTLCESGCSFVEPLHPSLGLQNVFSGRKRLGEEIGVPYRLASVPLPDTAMICRPALTCIQTTNGAVTLFADRLVRRENS